MTSEPQTTAPATDGLLRAYQVMATIVGINLILVMAGFIGKLVTEYGFFHDYADVFLVIDQLHGVLFIVLVVLVAKLTLRQKWSWLYMVSVLLLACIPLVSFWSERRTTHRVQRDRSHTA
ncbi:hypothetical protein BHE97_02170 [Aeromicrobium sp. PE09-221]|uniref:DUF3817 domain-containing protein n=1 Tax=Aeromicrobium sp. PE09-221 TaxID=1898043 RepID=UPI000B3EC7CE|nr:DUF3817 domain-containing protein [Aeromicrobium sp. PE09-221]OUZ12527.1 hypothetical protein BHE97_02170 [Aeromicrobium sp. PE09-221]